MNGTLVPDTITVRVPIRIVKRGGRKQMQPPDGAQQPQKDRPQLGQGSCTCGPVEADAGAGDFETTTELAERKRMPLSDMTRVCA